MIPIAAATPVTNSLFVYGTLRAPEVIQTLLDRVPVWESAKLLNPPTTPPVAVAVAKVDYNVEGISEHNDNSKRMIYRRYPVKASVYPGLVPVDDTTGNIDDPFIDGILYRDITMNEMNRLDYFEDIQYTKCNCRVQLSSSNIEEDKAVVETQTYVWTHPIDLLDTSNQWDYFNFRSNHLQEYLQQTVQPCRQQMDDEKI